MSSDAGGRAPGTTRKKRNMLKAFYGIGTEEAEKEKAAVPASELDGEDFDAHAYVGKMLRTGRVKDLVSQDVTITGEVHELDSELQMLVYGNYTNFISATELISNMKTSVSQMQGTMATLEANMERVGAAHGALRDRVSPMWEEVGKLSSITATLKKIEFLVRLPDRLKACEGEGAYRDVVRYWLAGERILTRHGHVKSFANVRQQCLPTVASVNAKLRARVAGADVDTAAGASALGDAVRLLLQLDPAFKADLARELFAVLAARAADGYAALCRELDTAHTTLCAASAADAVAGLAGSNPAARAAAARFTDDDDDGASSSEGDGEEGERDAAGAVGDHPSHADSVATHPRSRRAAVRAFFAGGRTRIKHVRAVLDDHGAGGAGEYERVAEAVAAAAQRDADATDGAVSPASAPARDPVAGEGTAPDGDDAANPLTLEYYAGRCRRVLDAHTRAVVRKVFEEVLVAEGEETMSAVGRRCAELIAAHVGGELRALRAVQRRARKGAAAATGATTTPIHQRYRAPESAVAAASVWTAAGDGGDVPSLPAAVLAKMRGLLPTGASGVPARHALAAACLNHSFAGMHPEAGFDALAVAAMQRYVTLSGQGLTAPVRTYFRAARAGVGACVQVLGEGGAGAGAAGGGGLPTSVSMAIWRVAAKMDQIRLEALEAAPHLDRETPIERDRRSRTSADAYSRGGLSRYTTGSDPGSHHRYPGGGGGFAPELHSVFATAPQYSLVLESLRCAAVVRVLVLYVLKTVLECARAYSIADAALPQLQVDVAYICAKFQEAMRADPHNELRPLSREILGAAQGRTAGRTALVMEDADVDAVVERVSKSV